MDQEKYCDCEDIKHWEISKTATPIHSRCGKIARVSFPDLIVHTHAKTLGRKNDNDFDGHEGHIIISMHYYSDATIMEIGKELNISQERVMSFLEALKMDAFMQRKYQYHQIENRQSGVLVIANSFCGKAPLSSDENDYGNVPKKFLKTGWVYPEES